jgi:predicted DNA-binding transcriptional regulator YafY
MSHLLATVRGMDGMSDDSGQTLARQWTMLQCIPRSPLRVTVGEIESRLKDEGFVASRRTLERDLHTLSGRFPLVLDSRSKPYGWSWAKGANFEFMPKLTPPEAVALLLAKTHLQTLLPKPMNKDLAPIFDAAERALATSGWKDWHHRTAVVPNAMSLLPPKIAADVLTGIEQAITRKRAVHATYRSKGSRTAKAITLHPLGLFSRGSVMYVVCLLFDYNDIRHLALHRLGKVDILELPRREPANFDFQTHVRTEGAALRSRGAIELKIRMEAAAAEHLRETPLSAHQTWTARDDELVDVSATVEDDERLRWWLLAFGSQLEVLSPSYLRDELSSELIMAANRYRVTTGRIK